MTAADRNDNRLTSTEAALMLGMDRTTTQRAAARGDVPGARQEERPGTINPPWCASQEAWRAWYDTRRQGRRPRYPWARIERTKDGFTALIGRYRVQTPPNRNSEDPGIRIEIWRDWTVRETSLDTYSDGRHMVTEWVPAETEYDREAINRIGGKGAIRFLAPTPEAVQEGVMRALRRARSQWDAAQRNMWALMDRRERGGLAGLVLCPWSDQAWDLAARVGAIWVKDVPEDDRDVESLHEYTQGYQYESEKYYEHPVMDAMVNLMNRRCWAEKERSGVELVHYVWEERWRKARTQADLLRLAVPALAWVSGSAADPPDGIITVQEWRRQIWGPDSPYAQA